MNNSIPEVDWSVPQLISIPKLLELCYPLGAWSSHVTERMVWNAYEDKQFEGRHWHRCWDRWDHARRIAYFMWHGWKDAITLDVGQSIGCYGWPILDGNHRASAAVLMKLPTIWAVGGGVVRELNELLAEV